MSGKRNVSVCRGHEFANALYLDSALKANPIPPRTALSLLRLNAFYSYLIKTPNNGAPKCKHVFTVVFIISSHPLYIDKILGHKAIITFIQQ